MRIAQLTILFLLSGAAASETLIRVQDATNPCQEYACMYYEWKVMPFEEIRFVASGYEDGIDYSFYSISESGEYELLLHVNPIIVDSEGRYWWGYPWTISDMARFESPCGLFVSATFDHEIVRDGNIQILEWQKRLQAVLFIGEPGNSNPNAQQDELDFKPAKIADLILSASEG